MTAQPAKHHEVPLDPQRILRELPGRERTNFLAAYREALDGARDPAGWRHLQRVLRLWSGMVIATNRPGFYDAQEAALTGTGGGLLLVGLHPTAPYPGVSYRPYLESSALRQLHGLQEHAFDMLVADPGQQRHDPYEPVFSAPTGVPRRRVADVGDFGFIVFAVDEAAGLIRVFDLVWTG